jgi:predicted NAD/FAD-dependent oxidoreductase
LTAARAVTKAGKRVVVLEARNRVGGRVKAGTIAGRKVDVGGMWAAATQTRVLELIKEFGCELVPQFEAGDRLRGSGLAFGSVESRVLYGFAGAGDFVERGGGDSEAAWAGTLGGDGDVGAVGGIYRWGGAERGAGGGRRRRFWGG